MKGRNKKSQREKDLTSRYLSGGYDEDRPDSEERFSPRNKARDQEKMARTAIMRADEASGIDIDSLPIGQVVQVHSLFCDVEYQGKSHLASVRRTLTKISDGYVVVGDRVRFRTGLTVPTEGQGADSVIEQILPRETILTRADSFKGMEQHPIVANAQQMLIVVSLREPRIKWGLIDRMLIAAQCGKLNPIICLNKIDLAGQDEQEAKDVVQAREALAHYESMNIRVLRTSVSNRIGLDELRAILAGQETVLAGHSGVGKSSLINSISGLNLRIGDISNYTGKGRHTTTSARRYPLTALEMNGTGAVNLSGAVIDTPGVKLFGLWGLTPETLKDYFPDITDGTAPEWRKDSYQRIAASLG